MINHSENHIGLPNKKSNYICKNIIKNIIMYLKNIIKECNYISKNTIIRGKQKMLLLQIFVICAIITALLYFVLKRV